MRIEKVAESECFTRFMLWMCFIAFTVAIVCLAVALPILIVRGV